jgi:hypothetical protein
MLLEDQFNQSKDDVHLLSSPFLRRENGMLDFKQSKAWI